MVPSKEAKLFTYRLLEEHFLQVNDAKIQFITLKLVKEKFDLVYHTISDENS